jgi:hypothetical protein
LVSQVHRVVAGRTQPFDNALRHTHVGEKAHVAGSTR